VTRDPDSDKTAELLRYDARAKAALTSASPNRRAFGAAAFDPVAREPFLCYEEFARSTILPDHEVLELGAGTGVHTLGLLSTGARVTATDISPNSLAVLERLLGGEGRLLTRLADIEALPFPDASFDVVTCAGSLSYGDPRTVDAEVLRVLRPGGSIIFVDVLDHNPVYRLNRWVHYLLGHRTRSTLLRMPTLPRIEGLARHFATSETRYFGGVVWAMPILARLAGMDRAAAISRASDRLLGTRRSAFKFVLLARGRR
jgi:ubiquinone/menaquinone biosynthesis C-methylase UbiE